MFTKVRSVNGNFLYQINKVILQKTLKLIILMGILSGFLSLFGHGNKTDTSESFILRAKQIKIAQLSGALSLLDQNKTEFDFIGITKWNRLYFFRKRQWKIPD
jgi:hypothetical protein